MTVNQPKVTFNESQARSVVKSLTYRVMSIIGTGIVTWIITRNIGKTLSITFANQLFLIMLYYFSERFWNRIHWGKNIHILPS
jgi:uncharacterized membrane protein